MIVQAHECERCRQTHFRNARLCSTCAEAVLGIAYVPAATRICNWLYRFWRDLKDGIHGRP